VTPLRVGGGLEAPVWANPPPKCLKITPRGWPGRPVCRSIEEMRFSGTMVNFGAAAATLALAGPYWGVIVFLSIALVRVTLDAHVLRRDNELLQERFELLESNLDLDVDADAPPESGTRQSRPLVAKRAS
jgi:hypothetical protein